MKEVRRWTSELSTRQGGTLGGVGAPPTLVHTRYSVGFFWSKNKFKELVVATVHSRHNAGHLVDLVLKVL